MKYFPDGISLEEAKNVYRTCAKTMHPDVGGDTDEFAILSTEYAAVRAQGALPVEFSYEDLMAPIRKKVEAVLDVLSEVYPRTNINIAYSYASVDVNFRDETPLPKMLVIEEIIRKFDFGIPVVLYFRRGQSVKRYPLVRISDTVYHCNMAPDEVPELENASNSYRGRRYVIWQTRKYAYSEDRKTGIKIIMHRNTKFTLQELMGL